MKEYKLTTKEGETLIKVRTESELLAIEIFCEIKKLGKKDLLEIYKVITC